MPRLKEIVNEKIKAEEHHDKKGGVIRKIDPGRRFGILSSIYTHGRKIEGDEAPKREKKFLAPPTIIGGLEISIESHFE